GHAPGVQQGSHCAIGEDGAPLVKPLPECHAAHAVPLHATSLLVTVPPTRCAGKSQGEYKFIGIPHPGRELRFLPSPPSPLSRSRPSVAGRGGRCHPTPLSQAAIAADRERGRPGAALARGEYTPRGLVGAGLRPAPTNPSTSPPPAARLANDARGAARRGEGTLKPDKNRKESAKFVACCTVIWYNSPRHATLAQSAEQALRKRQVIGSSPMGGFPPRNRLPGRFLYPSFSISQIGRASCRESVYIAVRVL